MCGHVGIAGDLANKDEALMKRLLIFDYFRGPDSTGFASIANNGDSKIAKIASHPINLFDTSRFKSALAGSSSKAFLGHNRLATRGVINEVNAHPYEFGHIVGAHNGTLETRDKWALEDALGEKFDVDSQALFAAIAKLGIEEVIPMLTSSDNATNSSAWALVWYDKEEGSINFLRNAHRPLWYGYETGFKRLLWGSQWEIIDNANRSTPENSPPTLDIWVEPGTDFKYWPFEEDIHYKFDLAALKAGSQERPKPKAKPLKGKEPAKGTTGVNPFGRQPVGFHGTHTHTSTESSSTTTSTTNCHGKHKPKNKDKRVDLVHFLGDIGSPFAGWVSEETFADMAKYGCTWCQADVEYGEPGVTIYDREGMLLCPACSGYDPADAAKATRIYVRGSQLEACL
jgi:hypothetical protein